jgi:hypothetical protein
MGDVRQAVVVSLQVLPAQQGPSFWPHFTHWYPAPPPSRRQRASASVHSWPPPAAAGQQAWPAFPHAHWPPLHIPYIGPPATVWQVWPSPMQRPPRQQLLPAHFDPGQHGSPGPPHFAQTLLWQSSPSPHWLLRQQASPGPPQPAHTEPATPAALVQRVLAS